MSDIDSILKTLDAELESAAKLEATVTAEGSAAQAQQTAVQQARVKLQQAKAALEALKLELQTRDKAVRDRAQQYFDDIEPVRKAVSAGGALADTVETAQSDAVGKALGLDPEHLQAELETLTKEVTDLDDATEKERADAVTKVKEAADKLDAWDDAFKASKEVIDAVEKALGTLATGATQLAAKGRTDLESLDKALTAGKSDAKKYYEAVVHLSDLHVHHAALVGPLLQVPEFTAEQDKSITKEVLKDKLAEFKEALNTASQGADELDATQLSDAILEAWENIRNAVESTASDMEKRAQVLINKFEKFKEMLKPESLEFDADESTASKLSGDILAAWDKIRKAVESTASERFKAELEVIKSDIDLAEEQAKYKLYQVKRVEDAAKAVEEKHAGAGGGGGTGGGAGGSGGGAGGAGGGAGSGGAGGGGNP